MKRTLLCFILPFIFFAKLDAGKKTTPEVIPGYLFLTIPKSGSHAVGKIFQLFVEMGHHLPQHLGGHLYHPKNGIYPQIKPYAGCTKKLILIRDFRDILVSAVFWFDKTLSENYMWKSIPTFDQKLMALIDGSLPEGTLNFLSANLKNLEMFTDPTSVHYSEYHIIKFENVIGEKGGGDSEAQAIEINNIAEFLGLHLTGNEIEYVAENLFGLREVDKVGVQTFRSGQIGDWKKYFKPHHIRAFNKKFGREMKRWGYAD